MAKTKAGNHVGGQLLGSGTSPHCHHGEAEAAEPPRDFVNKMSVCLMDVSNGHPVEVIYASSKTISILATVAPGFRLATVDRSFRSGLLCFQCQTEA